MAIANTPYPIQTYSDLKKAVAEWIDRDDEEFVNQIPNFINFAEKEIYRTLRVPALQKETYIQIVNGQATIPSDWIESVAMYSANGWIRPRETSFDEIIRRKHTLNNEEVLFTRVGRRWFFSPEINASITMINGEAPEDAMILNYYADTSEMTEDTDESPLLTLAPDLLLYTALKHACVFVQDKDGEQAWSDKASSSYQQLTQQTKSQDYSASNKVIRLANVNSYW
jgi:hypothetical protein